MWHGWQNCARVVHFVIWRWRLCVVMLQEVIFPSLVMSQLLLLFSVGHFLGDSEFQCSSVNRKIYECTFQSMFVDVREFVCNSHCA